MSLPQVIAHRGANDTEPEHSVAAYLRAIEQGANAVECDVRLTMDGTLVCIHDRRINRTSSGRGTVSSQFHSELDRSDFSGSLEKSTAVSLSTRCCVRLTFSRVSSSEPVKT